MKLYVWEDVLRDYTPGMICALAESEEQALEMIKKADDAAYYEITEGDDAEIKPKIVEIPKAFTCWGGG